MIEGIKSAGDASISFEDSLKQKRLTSGVEFAEFVVKHEINNQPITESDAQKIQPHIDFISFLNRNAGTYGVELRVEDTFCVSDSRFEEIKQKVASLTMYQTMGYGIIDYSR